MGTCLRRADIDEARGQLALRRADTLRKHAEELDRLDGDRAELETLDRLAAKFARSYRPVMIASLEPAASPIPASPVTHRRETQPRRQDQHEPHGRSNFETFARAVSKSTF